MIELRKVAHYVSDKIDVALLKAEEYVSTDSMISNRGGVNRGESLPEATRVTRYEPGDVLVSNIRPYFKKIWFANRISGCSNDILVFRTNEKSWNKKFLYYVLSQDSFFAFMMAGANGTKMPRGNKKIIPQFLVPDYPIEKQNKVVCILSAYDNLIENNKKQIKLLEEMAQRLYKEWFIDLRFPGWETTPIIDGVPKGWTKCTAGDVIAFNPKTSLAKDRIKQNVPMSALNTNSMVLNSSEFTMTELNSGAKFRNGDTLFARITPCLENGKTAFVSGLESEEGAVGSTELIVMRSKRINPYMVYLLARTDGFRKTAINSMTGSDGRQRAQVDKIQSFPFLLAPQSILDAFKLLVSPLFEQVYTKNRQNICLVQARDCLLPKLMNGEIEV